MAIDPLAVIASLCGRGGEVLSLKLHAMQDRIPAEDLAHAVEKVRRWWVVRVADGCVLVADDCGLVSTGYRLACALCSDGWRLLICELAAS